MAITESVDFQPTRAVLDEVLDALDEIGSSGGGARSPALRRLALETYDGLRRVKIPLPPRWRHDYRALSFSDVRWSTGRLPAPAATRRETERVAGDDGQDRTALAVENAGGIAHLGSIYLQPRERVADERLTLLALADATRTHAGRLAEVEDTIVPPDTDRFTALATAFQNCGAYVEIAPRGVLEAPVQLVWTSRPGEASAVFAHTVVRVGAGARATIVERHLGESETFTAGIVEVDVADGAELDYVVVQQADETSRVAFRRAARCGAGARIGWHVAELGGSLVRSVADARLAERGARSAVNAFFFGRGFANVDFVVDVQHAATATESRTIVRNAAADRAVGRFTGRVRIDSGAAGSDASMRDDALVLSRDAYLDATPALEIETNDVSGSHAATVGSLDEEALFYVQSRGIPRAGAARLIALAFFEAAIERFPGETLRDEVRTALDASLDETVASLAATVRAPKTKR